MEKKHLAVSIFGKEYTLSTDDDVALVEQAAHQVDTLMRRVLPSGSKGLSEKQEARIAVLVALQLAADLTKAQSSLEKVERKADGLNSLLETAL